MITSSRIILVALGTLLIVQPAHAALCRAAQVFINQVGDNDRVRCRSRMGVHFPGGLGCVVTCLETETTCGDVDFGNTTNAEDICGRARIRFGIYSFLRAKAQICLMPEDANGFLEQFRGRYCVTVHLCRYSEPCRCSAVFDGQRCQCRINDDGESEIDCSGVSNSLKDGERAGLSSLVQENPFLLTEDLEGGFATIRAQDINDIFVMFQEYISQVGNSDGSLTSRHP